MGELQKMTEDNRVGRANNLPISTLNFSARTYNCLRRNHIDTIGELCALSDEKIMSFKNLGKKSFAEIKEVKEAITVLNTAPEAITTINNDEKKNVDTQTEKIVDDKKIDYGYDMPWQGQLVENMDFSKKAKKILTSNGIQTENQLLCLTARDILGLHGCGITTQEEISEAITKLKFVYGEKIAHLGKDCKQIIAYFLGLFNETNKHTLMFTEEIVNNTEHYLYGSSKILTMQDLSDALIYDVLIQEYWWPTFQRILKQTCKDDKIDHETLDIIFGGKLSLVKDFYINIWLENNIIEIEEDYYVFVYPTIMNYAGTISDPRTRELVLLKLQGYTLDEIGKRYCVTRERVRQIISKAFDKKIKTIEDRFVNLYKEYEFNQESFCMITGLDKYSYEYMQYLGKKGNQELDGLIEREDLPSYIRINAERYAFRNYINDDGYRIKKNRIDICLYLLKKHKEPVTSEEFYEEYCTFTKKYGISDDRRVEINLRYIESNLQRQNNVLLLHGHRVAYTSVTESDMRDLLVEIEFYEHINVEISTKYFTDHYPEVMEEYGIYDEYALHNLLKKYLHSEEIKFMRQPVIVIGNGDRTQQVYDLLVEEAPISNYELAEKYQEKYGVDKYTCLANYFKEIDVYYNKGIYSVDYEELTDEEDQVLTEILTEDIMEIKDIQRRYQTLLPQHDPHKLSSYNYKKHGYKISTNLIYNANKFSNMDEVAESIFNDDQIDLSMRMWVLKNQSVAYKLQKKMRAKEIFYIEENKLISYPKVREYGLTQQMLVDFCTQVKAFAKGNIFTMRSLIKQGFINPYETAGLTEIFWESVLFSSGLFARQKMARKWIFKEAENGVMIFDSSRLIEEIVGKYRSISTDDLLGVLQYDYEIPVIEERLYNMIMDANVFYSSAKKKLYVNYERYYDEL